MRIVASSLGKKFGHRWIFRHLHHILEQGTSYAITGENGVGKSSLMLSLCDLLILSEGSVTWEAQGKAIEKSTYATYFHLVSPSVELPSEWRVVEFLEVVLTFYPTPHPEQIKNAILDDAWLRPYRQKYLYQLSSGTKTRLMLAVCFWIKKPILLLDEFSSHLDEKGKAWAFAHIQHLRKERLVVISTNDEREAELCEQRIHLTAPQET